MPFTRFLSLIRASLLWYKSPTQREQKPGTFSVIKNSLSYTHTQHARTGSMGWIRTLFLRPRRYWNRKSWRYLWIKLNLKSDSENHLWPPWCQYASELALPMTQFRSFSSSKGDGAALSLRPKLYLPTDRTNTYYFFLTPYVRPGFVLKRARSKDSADSRQLSSETKTAGQDFIVKLTDECKSSDYLHRQLLKCLVSPVCL